MFNGYFSLNAKTIVNDKKRSLERIRRSPPRLRTKGRVKKQQGAFVRQAAPTESISKIDIYYVVVDMSLIGRTTWAIAEGYIPGKSNGPAPEMTSHEACCILNASENDAHVSITIFFEDRDAVGPYRFTIAPRRTRHLRFNNFDDPAVIPRDTPYSSLIESDVPIVVQHTRLDSRQSENALLTTIAFPCN